MLTPTQKGAAFLLGSAFLYSIMPVLIRTLGAGNIPPMSQVFLRYIPAFLSALVYFLATKSKSEFKIQDVLPLLLLSVFGYALTNLWFTYGIIYTQVSTALFIFYCFGIITPVLAFVFLREKMNKFNWLALLVSIVALLLLFSPQPSATWKLGAFFATLAAFGQSFYLIGRKKLGNYSSKFLLLCSTFTGIVTLGMLSLIFENNFYTSPAGISTISLNTWIVTLLFGVDNFVAWLLMSKGFRLIKASTGSLILLVENVFAVTFALVFFQELPTVATLLGGGLILFASTVVIHKGDNS